MGMGSGGGAGGFACAFLGALQGQAKHLPGPSRQKAPLQLTSRPNLKN